MAQRRAALDRPDYNDVYQQARGWSDQALECRATGSHAWTNRRSAFVRKWDYYASQWTCARGCGVVKRQERDVRGRFIAGWLDYSEAPDYPSKVGRVSADTRGAVWVALLERGQVTTTTEDIKPRKDDYARGNAVRRRKLAQ